MPARLGQHFLHSRSALEKIADACRASAGSHVLEIGPGKGALTEQLLRTGARVTAVEVDPVLAGYLGQKFHGEPRFTLVHADILRVDLRQFGRITVAGNLPYYITSPILTRALAIGDLLEAAVFLVQKEVAERIAAQPGSRDYGFLSVLTQVFGEPKILFPVPPGAFRPAPKVDSAVIRIVPRASPLTADTSGFLEFASQAFRQKRKTLRNNLAPKYGAAIETMPEAGLRAEQLSVPELIGLRQRILKH